MIKERVSFLLLANNIYGMHIYDLRKRRASILVQWKKKLFHLSLDPSNLKLREKNKREEGFFFFIWPLLICW